MIDDATEVFVCESTMELTPSKQVRWSLGRAKAVSAHESIQSNSHWFDSSQFSPPTKKVSDLNLFDVIPDSVLLDGSLNSCVSGGTYEFGVSIRYGNMVQYEAEVYEQLLFTQKWLESRGGFHAYIDDIMQGSREPCITIDATICSKKFRFSVNHAGDFHIWIAIGEKMIKGCPFLVHVLPTTIDPALSHIQGTGMWSGLVGTMCSVKIRTFDHQSNQMRYSAARVVVEVTDPNGHALKVKLDDHLDGTYTASYIPLSGGDFTLYAAVSDVPIKGTPWLVTIKADDSKVDVTKTLLMDKDDCLNPDRRLTVGTEFGFFMVSYDIYSNRMKTGGIKFEAELKGPVLEKVIILDNGNGIYTGTFSFRWSGSYVLKVYCLGNHVKGSPFKIEVDPGPPYGPNCECSLVKRPMARQVSRVGIPCFFDIFTRDKFGNYCGHFGRNANISVTITGAERAECIVVDRQDGTYFASFLLTKVGDSFASILFEGYHIISSPFMISMDEGKTFAKNCTVDASSIMLGATAGTQQYFSIMSKDEYQNQRRHGGDQYQCWLVGPKPVIVKLVDNGDGSYNGSFTLERRGHYSLFVKLKDDINDDLIDMSPYFFQIESSIIEPSMSMAFGEDMYKSDPEHKAGEGCSFGVDTFDKYGNVLTKGGAKIDVSIKSLDGKYTGTSSYTDNNDGTFQIDYTCQMAAKYLIGVRINNVHIADSPFPFTVTCAESSNLTAVCTLENGLSMHNSVHHLRAGDTIKYFVQSYDRFGSINQLGGDKYKSLCTGTQNVPVACDELGNGRYIFCMSPIWVGDYEVNTFLEVMSTAMGSARLDFEKLTKGFMTFDVKPAPVDSNSCIPQGTAIYDTVAGNSVSVEVTTYDRFQNLYYEDAKIESYIQHDKSKKMVHILMTSNGQGVYSASYTLTLSGDWTLFMNIEGKPMLGSPFNMTIIPSGVFASNCTAKGEGLNSCTAGELAMFDVTTFDSFGNRKSNGGSKVIAILKGAGEGKCFVKDKGNGMYDISFKTTVVGSYELHVSIEGDAIAGSPFFPYCGPNITSTKLSYCKGAGTLCSVFNVPAVFTIQSVDLYGNEKSKGGDVWTVKLVGPGDVEPSVQDNEDGSYTVTYETSVRAIYKLHVTLEDKPITDSPFSIMSDRVFNRDWARTKLSGMISKGGNVKLSDITALDGDDDNEDEDSLQTNNRKGQSHGVQESEDQDDSEEPENEMDEYDPMKEIGDNALESTNDVAQLEAPPSELQPRKGFSLLTLFRSKK
jgi:hypothetical protein